MRVLRDLHNLIESVQAKRVNNTELGQYGGDSFEYKFRRSFRWLLFICDEGFSLIIDEELARRYHCFNMEVPVGSYDFCASFLEVFDLYSNNVHRDVKPYHDMVTTMERPRSSFGRCWQEGFAMIVFYHKPRFPEIQVKLRVKKPWLRKLCVTGSILSYSDALLLGDNSYVAFSPRGGDARMVYHKAVAQCCSLLIDLRNEADGSLHVK